VLLTAAAITAGGGLLTAVFVRIGPNFDTRSQQFDPRYAFRMFGQRRPRLVNLGYLGHMWDVNSDFRAPVRPGDTIRGEVEVVDVRTDKPVTSLKTRVVRQDGTVVLDGTAVYYTMAVGP
jgi:hypothetical protein